MIHVSGGLGLNMCLFHPAVSFKSSVQSTLSQLNFMLYTNHVPIALSS